MRRADVDRALTTSATLLEYAVTSFSSSEAIEAGMKCQVVTADATDALVTKFDALIRDAYFEVGMICYIFWDY